VPPSKKIPEKLPSSKSKGHDARLRIEKEANAESDRIKAEEEAKE
jgi:hypothetical protein